MEVLTTILCLLQIGNLIFSIRDKLEMTKEEKQALSELLVNIGNLIKDVSYDLEKNVYPHSKCYQMELYANDLKNLLKGKMTEQQVLKLEEYLSESIRVEKLLGELNNLPLENKDRNLEILRMSAVSFITSGEIIKVK